MAPPRIAMGLATNCANVQFGLLIVAVAMATSNTSADTSIEAKVATSVATLLEPHRKASSKGHDGFACAAGAIDWDLGWSAEKRNWCCKKSRVWCNSTDLLYDCMGKAEAWPVERAAWCCSRKHIGCDRLNLVIGKSSSPSPLLHHCDEDPWDWEMVWSYEKRAWCCKHHNIGCHTPKGSQQLAEAGVGKVPRRSDCRLAVAAAAAASFEGQDDSRWGWADPTREQCCQQHGLGCKESTTEPPPAQVIGFTEGDRQDTESAERPAAVSWLPYDCHAGLKNVRGAWDDGKKCWCCRHENLGCEEAKDTRECQGPPSRLPSWPDHDGENGHTSDTTAEPSVGHATTLAEDASAGTRPQLPALFNPCLQRGAAYSPDMLGTSITMETGIWECQLRCDRVIGCAHFSYWTIGGYCHIQDDKASLVRNLLPQVIAGPAKCGTDGNSDDKVEEECFELATAYFPTLAGHSHDFGEQSGLSETGVMRQCHRHCAQVADCAHFVVQFPERTCNLAGASARRLVRYQSVSGPRSCTAKVEPTEKPQDEAHGWVLMGGGLAGKFENSHGHQPSPTRAPSVGVPVVLPSNAILAAISAAAGFAGLLCIVALFASSTKLCRSCRCGLRQAVDGKRPVSANNRQITFWRLLKQEGSKGGASGGSSSGPGRPLENYSYAAL